MEEHRLKVNRKNISNITLGNGTAVIIDIMYISRLANESAETSWLLVGSLQTKRVVDSKKCIVTVFVLLF